MKAARCSVQMSFKEAARRAQKAPLKSFGGLDWVSVLANHEHSVGCHDLLDASAELGHRLSSGPARERRHVCDAWLAHMAGASDSTGHHCFLCAFTLAKNVFAGITAASGTAPVKGVDTLCVLVHFTGLHFLVTQATADDALMSRKFRNTLVSSNNTEPVFFEQLSFECIVLDKSRQQVSR